MTTAINIYADSVRVINDGDGQITATLGGIDPSQVAQEFQLDELLDAFDISDIQAYIDKRRSDDDE